MVSFGISCFGNGSDRQCQGVYSSFLVFEISKIFDFKFKSKLSNTSLKAKVLVPSIGNLASTAYSTVADYENILRADASKGWLEIKPGVNVIQVSHSVDGTFNVTITKPCAKGYYFQNRECIVRCAVEKSIAETEHDAMSYYTI